MGWQIGEQQSRKRHFSLTTGVDPINLMPKRPKSGGERQADDATNASSVIEPGSPEDPCRHLHRAFARVIETAQRFPEAYREIQEVLARVKDGEYD